MKKIIFLPFLIFCVLTVFLSCEKEVKITGTPSPFISLSDVRALYTGSATVLTADDMLGATLIGGIVISDPANGNAPEGLVILQNHRRTLLRGIALEMGEAAADYHSGDSLLVRIEGKTLERVNGILQISDIRTDDVTRISIDNPTHVNIETSTFTDITRWLDTYESTLVSIRNVMVVDMEAGEVFEGNKQASDGFNTISVTTLPTASFAAEEIPGYGSYTGIMLRDATEEPVLMLRNGNDYEVLSLEPPRPQELYMNFPEGWENRETSTKTAYGGTFDTFPSGEWSMPNAYTITSANMQYKTGLYGLMMNRTATTVTMNFNLPYGASKISFDYGVATQNNATDISGVPVNVKVEYSQDSGNTWTQIGADMMVTTHTQKYTAEYELNLTGPVRFRISKDGHTNASRIFIDEIAIYQN